jgi:hypothetical protein
MPPGDQMTEWVSLPFLFLRRLARKVLQLAYGYSKGSSAAKLSRQPQPPKLLPTYPDAITKRAMSTRWYWMAMSSDT